MRRSIAKQLLAAPGARGLLIACVMTTVAAMSAHGASISVTVSGAQPTNWDVGSFGPGSVSPGNDLVATQTGPNPTVTIAITGTSGNSPHTVTISRAADTTWDTTFTLWVQPLSTGAGAGSLTWSIPTGAWTQIPTAPTTLTLFTVRRDRTGVTLWLQLRNLTVVTGTTSSTPSFLTTLSYVYN